jgi:hypothetical protein
LQSYGVGALINATGTLSYKGAAYLGGLIFMATSAPGVSIPFPLQDDMLEKHPTKFSAGEAAEEEGLT